MKLPIQTDCGQSSGKSLWILDERTGRMHGFCLVSGSNPYRNTEIRFLALTLEVSGLV